MKSLSPRLAWYLMSFAVFMTSTVHGQGTVTITTPSQITDHSTDLITLTGTSMNLAGGLSWSNSLTGAWNPATGLADWTASGISLGVGVNTIRVWGTNSLGDEASASVTIKRLSKIETRLTAFYDFEGNFNDMPGAGVTNDDLRTVTGGSLTSDVPSNAKSSTQSYTFDNNVSYQTAQSDAWSPDLASADAYTIMFWFKGDNALQMDDNTRLVTVRFQEDGSDASNPVFQVEGFGRGSGDSMDTRLADPLAGLWFSPDAANIMDNDGNAANDVWHHVVFTLSNRGGPNGHAYSQAFVDGVRTGVGEVITSTGNPLGNKNGELILGGQVNIARSATGIMDDFALYEGVLDSNIIYNIANGILSPGDPMALQIEPSASATHDTTLDFEVNFSVPVTQFNDASDLVIMHNGTTNSGVTITGSNATYVVTLTGLSGEGTVTLAVNTNSDVQSLSAIPLAYSVASPAVVIEHTAPSVVLIGYSGPNPTSATNVTFDITFSEAVTNFDGASDLTITHIGTTNTGVTFSGGGSNYTATLTGVLGSGSYSLSVNTNSDITDLAGNSLTGMVTSAVVTQFIDSVPPHVVSIVQADSNYADLIVTFSEPVMGFSSTNVIIAGTNFSYFNFAGGNSLSSTIYRVYVDSAVADGASNASFTAVVDLNAGIMDLAGNPLTTPNPTSLVIVISADPYQLWAIHKGLVVNTNFNYSDDPDNDGRINGVEFMHDGDPFTPYDTFKERVHVATVSGENYVVLTIAAPDDAEYYDYSGDEWDAGYYYNSISVYEVIITSVNLGQGFGLGTATFLEDPSIPTPSGMPSLSPGFSYRHFRLTEPIPLQPSVFFLIDTQNDS